MFWKRVVAAGLLCVITAPVFGQPMLDVDYVGNNTWHVLASPDPDSFDTHPAFTLPGGALAFELGFRAVGGNFLTAVPNPNPPVPPLASGAPAPGGGPIEFFNPGNNIFGWETETEVRPGEFYPVGIQIGPGADANELFAALGSTFFTSAGPHHIMTITTQPSVTEVQWGGIFNANGTLGTPGTDFLTGRIAQGIPGVPNGAENFQGFAGNASVAVGQAGDFSGNGSVENADLTLLLDNWGSPVPPVPAGWVGAQPTPAAIDNDELTALLDNWGAGTGSGAALAAAGVPEPASVMLVGLALAAVGMLRRR